MADGIILRHRVSPGDASAVRVAMRFDASRRWFVGGALAASVAPWLPAAIGAVWQRDAAAAEAADAGPSSRAAAFGADVRTAFLRVSHALCGDVSLDDAQADVLLSGLQDQDAGFGTACIALDRFIAGQPADPLQWQAALDAAKVPFAALPRRIVSAWFIGVVGTGTKAKALTYVGSLMYRITADRLRPPSYAYGAYGTWRVNPSSVALPPLTGSA